MYKSFHSALILTFISLILHFSNVFAVAEAPQANVIVPGAKLEVIYNQGIHLEGPAVAPDGKVYFCDLTPSAFAKGVIYAGHIMKYDPVTKAVTVFRSPSGQADGLAFDAKGRLIAAEAADNGGRRITATDLSTGKAVILANQIDGHLFNAPNDIAIHASGRIYFTDPRYFGKESVDQPVLGVYCINTDGTVKLAIANAGKPNGIAISPDQKTLYVGSNDNGQTDYRKTTAGHKARRGFDGINAYDINEDGTVKFNRVLVQQDGFRPDGMRVDSEGNIFVANYNPTSPRRGIYVFSPNGKEIGYIQTPETVSNCEFGIGAESNVLYITGDKGLYKIATTHKGQKKAYQ